MSRNRLGRSWALQGVLVAIALISSLNAAAEKPSIAGADSAIGRDAFDRCVREGGRIQEVAPSRCVSKDGTVHIQTSVTAASCKNVCGDGQCQEIVCQAVGCPCAETPSSCPKDCTE